MSARRADRGWGRLRRAFRWVLWAPVLLAGVVLVELVPPLRAPEVYYAANPGAKEGLLGVVLLLSAAGLLLLVGAQFMVRWPRPEELTEAALGKGVRGWFSPLGEVEVEAPATGPLAVRPGSAVWWRRAFRHWGRSLGRSFHVEGPIAAMKQAGRTGAWRRHPVWQIAYLMGLGALLLLVGLFGIGIVLGPPLVRLICAGALAYALVRTTWAFVKA